MRTLRAQVTAILVVAVLVVIALANGASFFIARPQWPPFGDHGTHAADLLLMADLAAAVPQGTEVRSQIGAALLRHDPPAGDIDPVETRLMSEALARLGSTLPVQVLRRPPPSGPPGSAPPDDPGPDGAAGVTALRLPDGRWLVVDGRRPPRPPPGPPGGAVGFAVWLAFMILGVTGVVILAVHRLTRPLALVEEAARRIGPDGELPVLPERGPTEVRAAAAAINRLSARLKASMDSRMRIVAGAAHDLRTPLTRMRLRAEFIPDEEERAQWLSDLAELDRIADSAIRLVREEVEGGTLETVRIDRLAADVAMELKEIGLAVALLAAVPAYVAGRPLSLKRAVRNLAVNAATHGGGARLAVSADAERVVLVIEDDGPGIPEALMGQVFEPFFRVDPARQVKIPGAGLGLAIANEIIGRHGGRLTLSNRPGGGLLQRVELPAAEAGQGADE
ncbi:HAMP domain-containing protein [Xanthobacter autotrophicus]|uniref:ATP-binding protein n=1 Tax=Xanthobacter autotrophicus TaxID=280 RepID=UPI001E5A3C58|nr:ATP-binding protein [Xanthobacter autotrophicus]UDQ91038.1 HAMP domain-containing protein [Xanthobacter autotrophicus]